MPCFFKKLGWQSLLHGKMNLNLGISYTWHCIYCLSVWQNMKNKENLKKVVSFDIHILHPSRAWQTLKFGLQVCNEFLELFPSNIPLFLSFQPYMQSIIGAPVPSEARTGWNWFSLFWYGTRLPLGKRGATQKMNCTADICSSFLYGTRLPLGQRGAEMYILCFAPRCPRGSHVPYQNEEQISCAVNSQSCSSLSQRQSCPIPKWGASVLQGSPYGDNCVRDAVNVTRPAQLPLVNGCQNSGV